MSSAIQSLAQPLKGIFKYVGQAKQNLLYYASDKHGDRWGKKIYQYSTFLLRCDVNICIANRNMAYLIVTTWAVVVYKALTTRKKNAALLKVSFFKFFNTFSNFLLKEEKKRMKPYIVQDALARAGIH
jgi:hypothetical protein